MLFASADGTGNWFTKRLGDIYGVSYNMLLDSDYFSLISTQLL
jgi:hypothetical protein